MKKIIYTLFILIFLTGGLIAQQCTSPGSGPSQCSASGTLSQPGLSPRSDSVAPFTNGVASTTVIQFKNFNTVFISNLNLTVQSLRIDSIENLPAGLCWATDRANNTYGNSEDGCIKVNGTPCAQPGQYKLRIWVFVNVGFTSQLVNAETAGLKYFLRVGNNGDIIPDVDTLQTVPLYTTGYSSTAICGPTCPTLTFTQSTSANSSCDPANGSFDVSASGGAGPYTYSFSGGSNTTGSFSSLPGGTYTVTATDANQCTGTVTVTVGSTIPVIDLTVTKAAVTSCTNANGSITAVASGGSSPYNYILVPGSTNTTGVFTGLTSGSYTLTALDANACDKTITVVIADSTATVTVGTSSVNASTSTSANGTATANPSGGTGPYIFAWSGTAQTTQTVTGLLPGNYTVTATDVNGCSATASVTVGFTSGINNLGQEIFDLHIFPNPTTDNFTLTATLVDIKSVTIEIYNLLGERVQTKIIGSVSKIKENISVKNLSKGTYLVNIKADEKHAAYTIEIQ